MDIQKLFFCFLTLLLTTPAMAQTETEGSSKKVSDVTDQEDPYLWLEDVEGTEQLDWVKKRNKKTQEHFEASDSFKTLQSDLLKILDSDERIPMVAKRGDHYYNFWRDKDHVRGIWRRTTLEEYRKEDPKWEMVLDLDKLAETEGENWVWKGSSVLRPSYDLSLIHI